MSSRLDAELVRRGLATSRSRAVRLISAGRVTVDGAPVLRPARAVQDAERIDVATDSEDYVSRAGHKLSGALELLADHAPTIVGRRALDVGSSTGGFTDVLLRRGAAHVLAVDVGTDQLVEPLRGDPRVTVREQVNARYLTTEIVGDPPRLVVGDLSFISLTLVLEPIQRCVHPEADLLLLVKPQFEVGRHALGSGGVVRDHAQRADAVRTVTDLADDLGLALRAVVRSPLPGPAGNVECFVLLAARATRPGAAERAAMIERALTEGRAVVSEVLL